ncbi:Calcineurin-like phosphoesterase [Gracilibacillus ureilyticus]|uniref:Calcineurin-like phosphoesterase n=1 Tax=Gracilibacillus ureilyticus TaxID=531814 RepID=A0A1H9MKM7_9BACI|nr:metallophosphoesterase [Gracilibacillus ureilyticus]SER24264.1 Calcineurin-like phosphoesterase [Gracilibacillus ureilyticus]
MKFSIIGDLHFPDIDQNVEGLEAAKSGFFYSFFNHLFDSKADMYISLGDLTNYGSKEELEDVYQIINSKSREFYHVLGNHDLYSQPIEKVLNITKQPLYHSVVKEDAVFAFLNTAKEMDHEDWGGYLDKEQLAWLEEVVEASGTMPLFVFAHHPVYDTTARSHMEKLSIDPDIDMWQILHKKKGQGVYFNGHNHQNSIVQKDNWTFIQVAACLDVQGWRSVELTDNQMIMTDYTISNPLMAEQAAFLSAKMNHFRPYPEAAGTVNDRQCVLTFNKIREVIS